MIEAPCPRIGSGIHSAGSGSGLPEHVPSGIGSASGQSATNSSKKQARWTDCLGCRFLNPAPEPLSIPSSVHRQRSGNARGMPYLPTLIVKLLLPNRLKIDGKRSSFRSLGRASFSSWGILGQCTRAPVLRNSTRLSLRQNECRADRAPPWHSPCFYRRIYKSQYVSLTDPKE
jgi:hypothetical protein